MFGHQLVAVDIGVVVWRYESEELAAAEALALELLGCDGCCCCCGSGRYVFTELVAVPAVCPLFVPTLLWWMHIYLSGRLGQVVGSELVYPVFLEVAAEVRYSAGRRGREHFQ